MANNSEFVDPSIKEAVNNLTSGALASPTDPIVAEQKGFLKVEEPPRFNYGTPINDAIMNRARSKFYDPEISKGMQQLRYVTNQSQKLQNASNQIIDVYKLNKQAENIIRQRIAAEESQRAQVLSSILGLGGAVIGGMAAGPAGAAVGSQAGSMAGKKNNPNNEIV